MFRRAIALFVAQTFLLSSIGYAAPTDFATAPEKTAPALERVVITDPEQIVISRDYGIVKSHYAGDSGKLVIHIQDAHCNYEAQTNIAKVIEGLVKNDGLTLVSVEGADGIVDTTWFKAFPDEEIRKEVATYFMKKGEITGPEFLSITTDLPITLYGAETREYYIRNLNAFTSSYPLKAETERYYTGLKTVLNRLKGYIYNAGLKELDEKMAAYEAKEIEFNEYIRYLQGVCEKLKINIRAYDNFFKLVSVLVYEKKIDFDVVDKERSAVIDELTKMMSKDAITNLVTRSLEFKTGKISSVDFYAYLKALALQHQIDLAERYPNLFNYIIYNSVYARIENEELFSDIKSVETEIKEKLFQNDDQRTLEKLSRHAETLLGLINIKLLNDDFEYYKKHQEEFLPDYFAAFIRDKSIQYGLSYTLDEPNEAVARSVPKLEEFYAIAIKRDRALVDNTLKAMQDQKTPIAALVTGGFHSEGITQLLERQGISYLVVCPNITKNEPSPYIQILTNQRTSFEDLLTDTGVATSKGEMLAPFIIAEAVPLDEEEVRAVFSGADSMERLIGRVEAARVNFARENVTRWLKKVFAVAQNQRLARDLDTVKAAYLYAMENRLIRMKEAEATERGGTLTARDRQEITELIAAIRGAGGLDTAFHDAYNPALDEWRYAAQKPDTTERSKRVGEPLEDDLDVDPAIDYARRAGAWVTIFENGEVTPAGSAYAFVIDAMREAVEQLSDEKLALIADDHYVNASPAVKAALTKENLRAALAKDSALRIVLVPGYEDAPGILMTKEGDEYGCNFGHYSVRPDRNCLYLPKGFVDRLSDAAYRRHLFRECGVDDAGNVTDRRIIAADGLHELTEFVIVRDAFDRDMAAPARVAHRIAERVEKLVAGPSPKTKPSESAERSVLDDVLDQMTIDYERAGHALRTKAEMRRLLSGEQELPPVTRHERMAHDYREGRITVPTQPIRRMFRINDVSLDLTRLSAARRNRLLHRAANYFVYAAKNNLKVSISVMAGGEASRMKSGSMPVFLADAQRDVPDRFGDPGVGEDALPSAKALLPAAQINDGKWVTFLEYHLINVKRMNDTFAALGLGRPFVPKILGNAKYAPLFEALIKRMADEGWYGYTREDAAEVLLFDQPLGWRVAAMPRDVKAMKDDLIKKWGGNLAYEDALAYAEEHGGEVLTMFESVAEGHGEYYHSHLLPMARYGGKTMLEKHIEGRIQFDWLHNIDNMAPLNEDWLVLFGHMLENDYDVMFESSTKPRNKEAASGGGFIIPPGQNIPVQMEDDVFTASADEFRFDREADEAKNNPDHRLPSPLNNASLFTRMLDREARPGAFTAAYGPQGELPEALRIGDPEERAARLLKLAQEGRKRFHIVPTLKIKEHPQTGKPVVTVIFETRAWDIQGSLQDAVGVVRTYSYEDLKHIIDDTDDLYLAPEIITALPEVRGVRFDPLKIRDHYNNMLIQTTRQQFVRNVFTHSLLTDAFQYIVDKELQVAGARRFPDPRKSPGQQPFVGAVRTAGVYGLTDAEHDALNGTIARLIAAGQAYAIFEGAKWRTEYTPHAGDREIALERTDLTTVLEAQIGRDTPYKFIVVKGLKKALEDQHIASDVVFHYGGPRGQAYIAEEDLIAILSAPYGVELLLEGLRHEITHIEHPEWSEKEVESASPTMALRAAFAELELAAARKELAALAERAQQAKDIASVQEVADRLFTLSRTVNRLHAAVTYATSDARPALDALMVAKSRLARDLAGSLMRFGDAAAPYLAGLARNADAMMETFLREQIRIGKTRPEKADKVLATTRRYLAEWLAPENEIPDYMVQGIYRAMLEGRAADILYSFGAGWREFGTAGIRNPALQSSFPAIQKLELEEFADPETGRYAPVLAGPNLINAVTLLQQEASMVRIMRELQAKIAADDTAALAAFDPEFIENVKRNRVTIAYDSRLNGAYFAELLAAAFLRDGVQVDLFDRAAGVPHLAWAANREGSAFGILISASHSEANYNGFKAYLGHQMSQVDKTSKDMIVSARDKVKYGSMNLDLARPDADTTAIIVNKGTLRWITDAGPEDRYYGRERVPFYKWYYDLVQARSPLAMLDEATRSQIEAEKESNPLHVLYTAFFGVGAVPAADFRGFLTTQGYGAVDIVESQTLEMNGLFPGHQSPDPGITQGWTANLLDYITQYAGSDLRHIDEAIGALNAQEVGVATDPDIDRAGIMLGLPTGIRGNLKEPLIAAVTSYIEDAREDVIPAASKEELVASVTHDLQTRLNDKFLLTANDAWTFMMYWKLKMMEENGRLEKDRVYIIEKSHVTTSALERVAELYRNKGYQVYVVDTYVGFTAIGKKGRDNFRIARLSHEILQNLDEPREVAALLAQYKEANAELKANVPYQTAGIPIVEETIAGLEEIVAGRAQAAFVQQMSANLHALSRMHILAGVEESNGYGELGRWNPEKGVAELNHISDKDGSLAAYEFLELATYGRHIGKSAYDMYKDLIGDVGMVCTVNSALYHPGLTGVEEKLMEMEAFEKIFAYELQKRLDRGEEVKLFDGRYTVTKVEAYRNGEYDNNFLGFTEEGVRIYLTTASGNEVIATYRPSGTGDSNRDYNWLLGKRPPKQASGVVGRVPAEGVDLEAYRNTIEDEVAVMVRDFFGIEDQDAGYADLERTAFHGLIMALKEGGMNRQLEVLSKALTGAPIEFTPSEEALYEAVSAYAIAARTGANDEAELARKRVENRARWHTYLRSPEVVAMARSAKLSLVVRGETVAEIPRAATIAWQAGLVDYIIGHLQAAGVSRDEFVFPDEEITALVRERMDGTAPVRTAVSDIMLQTGRPHGVFTALGWSDSEKEKLELLEAMSRYSAGYLASLTRGDVANALPFLHSYRAAQDSLHRHSRTVGPLADLIEAGREPGVDVAIMPIGPTTPASRVIAVSPHGRDHIAAFLKTHGMAMLSEEETEPFFGPEQGLVKMNAFEAIGAIDRGTEPEPEGQDAAMHPSEDPAAEAVPADEVPAPDTAAMDLPEGGVAVPAEEILPMKAAELKPYIDRDSAQLHRTVTEIALDKHTYSRRGVVVIVTDTGMSDIRTAHVAQEADSLIIEVLGDDLVINVRGWGTVLLDELHAVLASLEDRHIAVQSVVSIVGDKTLTTEMQGEEGVTTVGAALREAGTVLNVQDMDGAFIPVAALYDLALQIGFDRGDDRILACLSRIGLVIDKDGRFDPTQDPDTARRALDAIRDGIIRLLPLLRPVDTAEHVRAQAAAQKVLHSL